MKIGIPRELQPAETRVAVIPAAVPALVNEGHEVLVGKDAGLAAYFTDAEYEKAGAKIVTDAAELYGAADVVLKVRPSAFHPEAKAHEVEMLSPGAVLAGFMAPLSERDTISRLAARKITSFSMEFVPRITRAQGMDALSSQATVAGYKAVLIAADHAPKMFPLLMTAAGSILPATVLVLGAGVAGLHAIATAKRLGARVEAFDPRPVVKEQVESLGAQFVEMEMPEDAETTGGYAKELGDEFLKKEQEAIAGRLPQVDAVITTAQIFGKQAPVLITAAMVAQMQPGAVIVDLAADHGGNCELSKPDAVIESHGVHIVGAVDLPAKVPVHASQMYSKNITNLFHHLFKAEDNGLDFEDQITREACITRDGRIVNELVRKAVGEGGQ
jgi:NAD(P) transhydrogenase subunit alpha